MEEKTRVKTNGSHANTRIRVNLRCTNTVYCPWERSNWRIGMRIENKKTLDSINWPLRQTNWNRYAIRAGWRTRDCSYSTRLFRNEVGAVLQVVLLESVVGTHRHHCHRLRPDLLRSSAIVAAVSFVKCPRQSDVRADPLASDLLVQRYRLVVFLMANKISQSQIYIYAFELLFFHSF